MIRRCVFEYKVYLLWFTLLLNLSSGVLAGSCYKDAAEKLPESTLRNFTVVLTELSQCKNTNIRPLLQYLMSGHLYYRLSDKTLWVVSERLEKNYIAYQPLSKNKKYSVDKHSIKKIRINNRIRVYLKEILARMDLYSSDSNVRLQAVKTILKKPSSNNIDLLLDIKKNEKNVEVLGLINTAVALRDIHSDDQLIRLQAIEALAGNLHPLVRVHLKEILEKNNKGNYIEKNILVVNSSNMVLSGIESKVQCYQFLETLFFGLSLGSVLLLVAIGLAITFGVMGVINMAHGELIMIGAYTSYVVQLLMPNYIEWSLLVAIPVAFFASALVGLCIERGVIQFLHGRPLETLLATFGISLILQQAVRSVFSALNRQVETPQWMSGSLEINSALSLTYNRLYILMFAILVFIVMHYIFKKTSLGLYVRAVSQNRNMAKVMGIRSHYVDAITFSLGSGIAGIAGVALSQLTNVGPNLGQAYIIDSFMVVVFGGVGNLWGTFVGALSLGIMDKFLEPFTGSVLAKIIVLVFIVLFIQKKPKGLFPPKGRNVE